jgi:predicted Zn-dependent peptidase
MYNGLLGAFPHSKLFVNVREKASLAYYASSRLDGHKGLITIQSGIEIANYGKVLDMIREQLASMERGEFGEEDIARTRAMLSNQLREIDDSAFERIGFDFHSILSGRERTGEQMIRALEAVTPEQIAAAARGVRLDTIYFLRDRRGEG